MHRAILTALTAILLTISTIMIICSVEQKSICGPVDNYDIIFHKYKDYCVLPHAIKGEMDYNLDANDRVTLAIHASSEYIDEKLNDQVDAWEGPVSLAVSISSENPVKEIHSIQKQFSKLPSNVLAKLGVHMFFRSNGSCENIEASIPTNHTSEPYPANIARNIARMFVRSKYILPTDYEFIPSLKFETRMRKLTNQVLSRNPKTVLVCRIFEINDTVKRLPRTKSELRKLYHKGLAIEFHEKYTLNSHKIPYLKQWLKTEENFEKLSIASVIPFKRYDWEPQFVSLNSIPLHDENFPFGIRDNSVLRWEMCRQNYSFALVEDLFMVHRGIKLSFSSEKTRMLKRKAKPIFQKALEKFRQRMDKLYPETKSVCPELSP